MVLNRLLFRVLGKFVFFPVSSSLFPVCERLGKIGNAD